MPVLTRLFPSPIVMDIRAGALDDLAGVLADQRISDSGRLAVAVSRGYGAQLRERLAPSLPAATWFEVGGGTLDEAVDLADRMKSGDFDAVVGIGGGKIIDCAKYSAARIGLPLVVVPTNLSHDGHLLARVQPGQRRRARLLRSARAHRPVHRPGRDPRGPAALRALGDRGRPVQHLRGRGLGAGPPGQRREDRRSRRGHGPSGRRGGPAAPRRLRRRRVPHRALRGSGADRYRHVDSGAHPALLGRLPRDQPRAGPALPPAGPPRTANRWASAPRSPRICAATTTAPG